ncbi:MAG TPA: hypothetical protein VFL91_08465 [Thermomicrobiales bacterium]|nr:hypothetical protein [Thermomicrobiales bacterium]
MTVEPFDVTTIVAILTGVLLPLAIAALRARQASSRFAAVFAFLVCVVVAAVQAYLTKVILGGQPQTADDWVRLILSDVVIVLYTAWLFYDKLWKPTLVVDALETRGLQLGAPPPPPPPPVVSAPTTRVRKPRAPKPPPPSTPDTSVAVERPAAPPKPKA